MSFQEWNFDGIVGPTHHFGGLGVGNIASESHRGQVANPRAAAWQGIDKMAAVASLGVPQAVLPPPVRPHLQWLRTIGFAGTETDVIQSAAACAPALLAAAYSSSAMWRANSATVSSAANTADGKLHLTVANLCSSFHRQIEAQETLSLLNAIFAKMPNTVVHAPLPPSHAFRDEGAANHLHLCDHAGRNGIEVFVHGDAGYSNAKKKSIKFPARQSLLASEAVARLHQLPDTDTFFLTQHPAAIDAGAFHNDVVATSFRNVLLYHERAFFDANATLAELSRRFQQKSGQMLYAIQISEAELPLADTVQSYFFNSQLVLTGGAGPGPLTMICPAQCESFPAVRKIITRLIQDDSPIGHVRFVPLYESMNNGGGPACLRLRVSLSDDQANNLPRTIVFNESLEQRLRTWVGNHYRDQLSLADLADPRLLAESRKSSLELHELLGLPHP